MTNQNIPINKLKNTAIALPVFIFIFIIFPSWLFYSDSPVAMRNYGLIGAASIFASIAYYIAGHFFSNPKTARTMAKTNAIAAIPIGILPFGLLSFTYLFFTAQSTLFKITYSATILISAILWVKIKITAFKKYISQDKNIKKNLSFHEDYIHLKKIPTTEFDQPVLNKNNPLGKLLNKINNKIATIISTIVPAGYFISQISIKSNSVDELIFCISVFSLLISLHIWSNMACSFYYYQVLINSLEKQHGKIVYINPPSPKETELKNT